MERVETYHLGVRRVAPCMWKRSQALISDTGVAKQAQNEAL